MGLLESALAMPQAGFGDQFFHIDLFEMAAAYVYHIAKNHPFVDGNKRTGAMAAFTFFKLNGVTLGAPDLEFEKIVLSAAAGKADKSAIAAFFRKNASHRTSGAPSRSSLLDPTRQHGRDGGLHQCSPSP